MKQIFCSNSMTGRNSERRLLLPRSSKEIYLMFPNLQCLAPYPVLIVTWRNPYYLLHHQKHTILLPLNH